MQFSSIQVHDKQLAYQFIDIGAPPSSPVLVFLHEALGSMALWKTFPKDLCQICGFNGLLYDRQGHGHSDPMSLPRPSDYLEIEAWHYLPELLDQMEIEKPILFGHSDGGSIALLYAAKHPVSALITEAAHIYIEPETIQGIKLALEQMQTNNLKTKLARYHGGKTEILISAWAETWLSEPFQKWDISEYLPQIYAPTLLLQGKSDEFATAQQLYDIEEMTGGNAKALLLDDCGHIPHFHAKEWKSFSN